MEGRAHVVACPDRGIEVLEMNPAQAERIARAKERIGKVLKSKYRLDRVLGVGGMAAVYAATHLRNASRVAVKVLHKEMAADENVRARFLREGYAANSVEHTGTVRILDDDTGEDGSVFLVMELLEGETLDQRWERSGRRLNAREVARLLYKLLDVLAAAHAKGIVHRDIKPDNLFLTREGAMKVLDFGVARIVEAPVTSTRPGGIVGTPAFMAPEQVLGKTVDAQSDLWSAGATAFTLLARSFVHEATTAQEMMVMVGSRVARSLEMVAPDVPSPLARVVDHALMFNKEDRWPDARTMQRALADAYQAAFDAPMPGTEDADDSSALRLADLASGNISLPPERHFDRSSAVTVLTGATPVISQPPDPVSPGTLPRARRRPSRQTVIAGGIVLLSVVIGLVVTITAVGPAPGEVSAGSGASSRAASPAASATPSAQSAAWTAPAVAIHSIISEPPSVPVESLPAVGQAAPVAAPAPPPVAPVPSAPAARPAARPAANCSPPFTTDPDTGKKKWKLECL
jgi:eukaryotic-like serine/threonine-protein kinase